MIDGSLRFPQAVLIALVLHACVLLLVRLPSPTPETSPVRSLIVHLSAISERAAAPESESQPAAPSIPSLTSAAAAVPSERANEHELIAAQPIEDETDMLDGSRAVAARTPASEERVNNVEPARMDSASLDERAPAVPTDRSAEIADEVRASYQDALADWLRRHRQYPMHLRRRGVEGDGSLRLRVDRSGDVAGVRMESPIPDARLNELTMELVRRASPFPRMPDELEGESFECVIDIRYRIGD